MCNKEDSGVRSVAAEELDERDTLPEGTYWDADLDRYVRPKDPEWSREAAAELGLLD